VAGRAHYDWERFWIDADRRAEGDFEGFFPDPRNDFEWLRPRVPARTLIELQDDPCLILLGEPGLGRSRAIGAAMDALRGQALVDRIDLAANPDASSLRSRMTESTAWREWAEGERTLQLFSTASTRRLCRSPRSTSSCSRSSRTCRVHWGPFT
jgi:hypothetical protein